ncbi:N-acetyltransferase domain-containing protein [Citrus sinensis]|nr:N-acetyltransferase domain-containing protein [Citrus sinensis]
MDPSRISLRPYNLSDVDDFLLWASDDRVTRYLRWDTITSREEALAYLEMVAIPHPWRRSICLDDRSIGYISIKPESGDDRCRAHIGYAVAAGYWGHGMATLALKMVVSKVFDEIPDLVRLHALVELENKASQRVLEKVGFVKEGYLLDQPHLDQDLSSYAFFSKYSCVHRNKSEHAGCFPGVNSPNLKSDMKALGTLATDLMAFWNTAEMALCFLQEIGLADDVLVDEQDIPAPAPPDTRLLRDTSVRRTLPSDICSSCLVSSTYFSQTSVPQFLVLGNVVDQQ